MTSRTLQLMLAFAMGIAAASYCYFVYCEFDNRWNYLTWDPAAHGWDGMRIALDIKNFRPVKLLEDTNQLVLWPPLHSYLQVPYFLMWGIDFHSAVLCSLTFLAILLPALTWFYQQLDVSWAGWLALIGFSVTSPMFLAYGTMPMLEIFGAFLTAFSASLFLRRSRWFPLAFALLFFLKYNYFFYLLLAVLLFHSSKNNVIRLREFIRPMKPFLVMIGIFFLLALTILITGGFEVGPLSVRGIGNPAYILFLITIAGIFWKRQHLVLWKMIKGTGWEWFVIPVLIWMMIPVPNRVKTILSFAISRPLGSPPGTTLDYYFYYLEKFPLYFADYWIAWLALVILIAVTILFRKQREILFVGGLFVLPFLLMTLNQNKQDRYLFTFVPALWILVGYAIARIPNNVLRFTAALTICATLALSLNLDLVRKTIRWQFAPLRARNPVNFIAARISTAGNVRVLGATNELNPASIQYHSGAQSEFSMDQHFDWEVEAHPKTDLHIICIDCETSGNLLRSRTFPGGIVVRHYFLDTPDGAPYNPIQ